MIRVIVCGGKAFADQRTIEESLDAVRRKRGDFEAVVVGSGSASLLASLWAVSRGLKHEWHEPAWGAHGARAGRIANQFALDLGADAVVAFPGPAVVDHMVEIARSAGVPVWRPKPIV